MRLTNSLSLFVFLLSTLFLFNSCTKEPLMDEFDQIEEITLEEEGFTEIDMPGVETELTRNSCQIQVCATFTGTGRYRVTLPNGDIIFANLNNQTATYNGSPIPFSNPFCATIPVNMSSTANLAFKGSGSVVVTAQVLPGGTISQIFSAGVGTSSVVFESEDVTLTCPTLGCNIQISATFTGTGRYRVILPNGDIIFANLNNQTATFNGFPIPFSNPLVASIFVSGSSTANLAFKGSGSVVVTATWPDGTVCEIFSAGVGISSVVFESEDVTLTCDPPC